MNRRFLIVLAMLAITLGTDRYLARSSLGQSPVSQPPAAAECKDGTCKIRPNKPGAVSPVGRIVITHRSVGPKTPYSLGSGTVVDIHDDAALVLTNWHVVTPDASDTPIERIDVHFGDGTKCEAFLLGTDEEWDLAALVISPPSDWLHEGQTLEPIELADDPPVPGEILTMAGYGSNGVLRIQSGQFTQLLAPNGTTHLYELMEFRANAVIGDSGGPICNSGGRLCGVLFGNGGHRQTTGAHVRPIRRFLDRIKWRLRHPLQPPRNNPYRAGSPGRQLGPPRQQPPQRPPQRPPANSVPPAGAPGPPEASPPRHEWVPSSEEPGSLVEVPPPRPVQRSDEDQRLIHKQAADRDAAQAENRSLKEKLAARAAHAVEAITPHASTPIGHVAERVATNRLVGLLVNLGLSATVAGWVAPVAAGLGIYLLGKTGGGLFRKWRNRRSGNGPAYQRPATGELLGPAKKQLEAAIAAATGGNAPPAATNQAASAPDIYRLSSAYADDLGEKRVKHDGMTLGQEALLAQLHKEANQKLSAGHFAEFTDAKSLALAIDHWVMGKFLARHGVRSALTTDMPIA